MIMVVVVIAFIVFMERAQRRLLVQYPKRQMGNKMMGGESSHLPLKLNTAGVIPPIFASSLLLLPMTIANFSGGRAGVMTTVTALLGAGNRLIWPYMLLALSFSAFSIHRSFSTQPIRRII
jgi:preprotein translocase subunit SecY